MNVQRNLRNWEPDWRKELIVSILSLLSCQTMKSRFSRSSNIDNMVLLKQNFSSQKSSLKLIWKGSSNPYLFCDFFLPISEGKAEHKEHKKQPTASRHVGGSMLVPRSPSDECANKGQMLSRNLRDQGGSIKRHAF